MLDLSLSNKRIERLWADEIVPQLHRYIEIPALSPSFDAAWNQSGHIADAVALIKGWIEAQPVDGTTVTVEHLPGRTPLVVAEIEPFGPADQAVGVDDRALRPPRQAARDGGLAGRPRPVETGDGGNAPLRSGWGR